MSDSTVVIVPPPSHPVTVSGPPDSPTVVVGAAAPAEVRVEASLGLTGPKGDPGPPGPGGSETHVFDVAARIWTVSHSIPTPPAVTVRDAGRNVVIAEVHYQDETTVLVMHADPTTGSVLLT